MRLGDSSLPLEPKRVLTRKYQDPYLLPFFGCLSIPGPVLSCHHSLPIPPCSSLSLSASFLCDYRHCMVISAKLICTTTVNWLQQLINVLEIWHWKKKVCHQKKGKKLQSKVPIKIEGRLQKPSWASNFRLASDAFPLSTSTHFLPSSFIFFLFLFPSHPSSLSLSLSSSLSLSVFYNLSKLISLIKYSMTNGQSM